MPQGWDSVRYQFVDTLSHTIGRHELKAGVDMQLDDQNTYFLGNKDGTFTFRTDAPFDPNDRSTYPFQYTQTIGDWYDPRKNEIYSGFVQDTWRAHESPDRQRRPALRHRDDLREGARRSTSIRISNNVAPRVGATWTATERRTHRRARRLRRLLRPGLQQHLRQHQQLGALDQRHGAESRIPRSVCRRHHRRDQAEHHDRRADDRHAVDADRRASASRRELRPGLAVSVDGVRTLGYDLFNALDINAPLPGASVRPDPTICASCSTRRPAAAGRTRCSSSLERRSGRGPDVQRLVHALGRGPQRRGLRLRAAGFLQLRRRRRPPPATIAATSSWRRRCGRCRGASRPRGCCRRAAGCRGT